MVSRQNLFRFLVFAAMSFMFIVPCKAQSDTELSQSVFALPAKFISRLEGKASKLNAKVIAATEKSLKRMQKHELRLKRKLMKKDSSQAGRLFAESDKKYAEMLQKLKSNQFTDLQGKRYDGHLDKLNSALKLADQSGSQMPGSDKLLSVAREQLAGLECRLDGSEQVQAWIKERQGLLKSELSKLNLGKSLLKYNKEVHYYSAQIKEYRSILSSPDKLEQKVMSSIQGLPIFKDFMKKHSAFAAMFPVPVDGSGGVVPPGAQTLSQVDALIQSRTGSPGLTGGQIMQSQLHGAEKAITGLQEKVTSKLGLNNPGEDADFKPNDQKVKSFKKRLELGTNLQTIKSNNFFPTTTDVGLSLGYKLNSSGIIGIGASYKVGWGSSINHIRISHEGIGIRTFIDWKLKGSFYISGGYEQNYRSSFRSIEELKGLSQWQQSGLLGISKIVSLKSKLFKKTKAQLLWDWLSYRQIPQEQPVKFRLGYNF